ncbi:MAG: YggS family pyridoxal phosphate-dependent enzyme [Actinomycetales bacterium]|nr:MAG: YggS family pyridoxal phosphate-dependent enzyme [Actinomycetales bacterium]
MPAPERCRELACRLDSVRERVTTAARGCGRDPGDLTIIVVTKFFPASDVRALLQLGVRDFGENRHQEARAKFAEVRGTDETVPAVGTAPVLHFIGQVQTNKAAAVAAYADVVHAVDRPRLVRALEHGAARSGRQLRCLVQVDLADDALAPGRSGDTSRPELGRGGVTPGGLIGVADLIAESAHLQLGGVMAVAPLGADPDPAFTRLEDLSDRLRERHPGATWVSAGMSGDLEAAIRHGATHLRVGTAILGSRPVLR